MDDRSRCRAAQRGARRDPVAVTRALTPPESRAGRSSSVTRVLRLRSVLPGMPPPSRRRRTLSSAEEAMADEQTGGAITDRITGKLKKVAGAVLGDDQLAAEGELHEARADAKSEAAHVEARAEQADAEAELAAREEALAV